MHNSKISLNSTPNRESICALMKNKLTVMLLSSFTSLVKTNYSTEKFCSGACLFFIPSSLTEEIFLPDAKRCSFTNYRRQFKENISIIFIY